MSAHPIAAPVSEVPNGILAVPGTTCAVAIVDATRACVEDLPQAWPCAMRLRG